uniref:Uncharacterized protein n=1 Tax=Medicago truncatula TaxID=3880 RepID=B7FIA3_MEDTR|nr:unknown [Medicago truncatula]
MCSSKAKEVTVGIESSTAPHVARINGRPVLQPTCNHVPNLERRNSIKKSTPKSLSPLPLPNKTNTSSLTPPISPKPKSPTSTRPLAIKRGNDNNGLNLSCEKISIPKNIMKTPTLERKKSKSFKEGSFGIEAASLSYSSSLITDSPGSIAAVRREQVALQQAQRKNEDCSLWKIKIC